MNRHQDDNSGAKVILPDPKAGDASKPPKPGLDSNPYIPYTIEPKGEISPPEQAARTTEPLPRSKADHPLLTRRIKPAKAMNDHPDPSEAPNRAALRMHRKKT